MYQPPSPTETLAQILREREPNFLRLYLNPHVAQVCVCLDRYVRTTWAAPSTRAPGRAAETEVCQSFLANGLEEALGGAIKLVRYSRGATGIRRVCVILDPDDRLVGFADAELAGGEEGVVEFLPGIRAVMGGRSGLRSHEESRRIRGWNARGGRSAGPGRRGRRRRHP